jgi:hypothetical protein
MAASVVAYPLIIAVGTRAFDCRLDKTRVNQRLILRTNRRVEQNCDVR